MTESNAEGGKDEVDNVIEGNYSAEFILWTKKKNRQYNSLQMMKQ